MTKKSFYAVKKGNKTGVFSSWEECQEAIKGFSCAEYKGFYTLEEAEAYLNGENIYFEVVKKDIEEGYIVAYTDGTYNDQTQEYAYGVCIINEKLEEITLCDKLKYAGFLSNQNIAGEVFAVLTALDWAVSNGYEKIKIYHDLEHISKWASGEYTANSDVAKFFVKKLDDKYKGVIEVKYEKVKGHSNNPYNNKADGLAKSAIQGKRELIKGANSFTVKNFRKEDLDPIIELLVEDNKDIYTEQKDINGGKQIKIKLSSFSATVKFFTNSNKLLVQGKANPLFQMLLTYVTALLSETEIVPLVKEAYRISVNKKTVNDNFENYCPNITETYNENIRKLIKQAIINLNSYFEAEDYSQYAFPALKALEGHIKMMFSKTGIYYKANIGEVFHFDQTSSYYYLDNQNISEPEKSNIEKCYNHYNTTRHKVFHFGDVIGNIDNTFVYSSKDEVNQDIIKTLKLINDTI